MRSLALLVVCLAVAPSAAAARVSALPLVELNLTGAAALTYDPANVAFDASSGDRALDRDPATSWTVSRPTGKRRAGLLVELPALRRVRGIRLLSNTGLRADVYTATSPLIPPTITDPRWTNQRSVRLPRNATRTYRFKGRGAQARSVVIWVTGGGEANTRRVGLSTVRLLGSL